MYDEGDFDYYFFDKNIFGDIVGIYNQNGRKICTYTYDAWGVCETTLSSGISSIERAVADQYNPFRYRGYFYDVETGYYYLQTRYYNPEWGRFLNADSALYGNMLGFNLFAYCYNNPVNYFDPTGESGIAAVLAGWASSAWGLMLVDGLLPVGDIIYVGGIIILSIVVVVDTAILAEKVADLVQEAPNSDAESDKTHAGGLPNQGVVSEDPDAPPVDAGKQGKHVPGHKNNTNPDKSTWRPGENGVRETQEAWKNGKEVPGRNGVVRIGTSSDGRIIKVHMDGRGNIHGYPIYPKS